MRHSLSVAVIGAGTGGLATAAMLKRDGHQVTLFEKFDTAKPVGAGLLLQPTGLACLCGMGLDEAAIRHGAVVNSLYGETKSGKLIFDVAYSELKAGYFGVGIHRARLFQILYDEATKLGVTLRTGTEIKQSLLVEDKREVFSSQGECLGAFDLVVDASGRNSRLRPQNLEKHNKPYPYGAIWGLLQDPGHRFSLNKLQQRYHHASIMVGLLPVGKGPGDCVEHCTFFWSLPPGGYEHWLREGMTAWKSRVLNYWPELSELLTQFQSHDQLIHAQYSDIILTQWHQERMVFVGDAGHNSSPQLGQGANLALCDAMVLAENIKRHSSVDKALSVYSQQRKSHIHFYQFASRWLTPFFQSDGTFLAKVRDGVFAPMGRSPWLRTQMLKTLAGVKTGPFSQLEPGKWHNKYKLGEQ